MAAKKRKLSMQSHRWHPRVVQSVTCPTRELSSPRVVSPWVGVSASCPVTVVMWSCMELFAMSPARRQSVTHGTLCQTETEKTHMLGTESHHLAPLWHFWYFGTLIQVSRFTSCLLRHAVYACLYLSRLWHNCLLNCICECDCVT